MTVIHHDADLRIVAVAKAQVIHAAANLDNTILVQTAFVTVANRNTVGTHAGRTLELLECLTTIIRVVVTQRLNVALMLIRILLVVLGLCQNSNIRLLVDVGWLTNTNTVALITILSLEDVDGLVKLTFGDAKNQICAFRHVNHALFIDFRLQRLGDFLSLICLLADTVAVHGANSRLGKA